MTEGSCAARVSGWRIYSLYLYIARSGPGRTLVTIAGLILILDLELDELGSLISPFKDILGYNYKNNKDRRNRKKRGLGDLYGKFLQLHLHYICTRRKPHGLIARAWGKSLPGPAHGLEPTAQQLRPLVHGTRCVQFTCLRQARPSVWDTSSQTPAWYNTSRMRTGTRQAVRGPIIRSSFLLLGRIRFHRKPALRSWFSKDY